MQALKRLQHFKGRRGPLVLCIMDGIGYAEAGEGNAVEAANTPTLDALHATCLGTRLKAHGLAVGMPSDGDMGNSEIGHNAIGCGRVFAQGAKLVNESLASGALFQGAVWRELVDGCCRDHGTLHFIGLLSDGNVHSHIRHLRAMIEQAHRESITRLRVHPLLDGRDVGETSALDYVLPLEEFLAGFEGVDYRIASGGGRMQITMDRYGANWDMVRQGWEVHVHGVGRQFAAASEAIRTYRAEQPGVIDQDLPAFVVAEAGTPVGPIEDGDSVIMFNFRGDRAMELSNAFEMDDFTHFDRGRRPRVLYAGMMEYDGDLKIPGRYLVAPPTITRTMGEYLCASGARQLAISETQKFGHVTYFFNGNRSGKFDETLERYVEVPSDRVPFEQRPWMKAAEITDAVLHELAEREQEFIRLNFANGDMVGHTGNLAAARVAVETVDLCVARLVAAVRAAGGTMILTADHGNAEEMFEHNADGSTKMEDGRPKAKTSHTLNPVPCLIYDPEFKDDYRLREGVDFGIASLAATCINLLGYAAPEDYTPGVIDVE